MFKSPITAAATALIVAMLPASAQQIRNDDGSVATAEPPIHIRAQPRSDTPSGVFPAQMRKAYGIDQLANQGAGQIIGIVDAFDDPNIEADLGVFTTQFGLAPCTTANGCFQKVYASGSQPATNPGWTLEMSLDVEWAHVIAPQATILLVEAASANFTDLFAAVDVAVQHGASVVSMSFGGREFSSETANDSHFSVPNVTFVASSGDSGHGVEYPAASPFVLGVGGTTLTIQPDGTYVSETAWSGSGGGVSRFEVEPAYQNTVQQTGARTVPDIAMDADPNTGVPVFDSINFQGHVNWTQVGGTSLAAPMWSALIAIANSSRAALSKAPLTAVQTPIYSTLFTDLNDIAGGSNGRCPLACKAVPGYDQITGLGSPMANALIPALVALP